ncbi:MAG: hypothetical protein K2J20_01875, partial [Bacilli bacterium]|nr:hypothetical protein [Bacilli bacterium]
SKYIGYLTRKLEHERLISEQEKVVNELSQKIEHLTNLLNNSKEKIDTLNSEKEHFPKNTNLRNITTEIERLNAKNEIVLKEEHQSEENLRSLNNELSNLLLELNKLKKDNKIPLNLTSFKEACAIISEIKTAIYELKTTINTIKSTKELINSKKAHIESSEDNQDELFEAIALTNEELAKYEIEHASINEKLNTKEYKELSLKLKGIEEIITSYNSKNSEYAKEIGVIETEIKNEEEKLNRLDTNIKQSETILEIYYNILQEEHSLGYVLKDFTLTKDNIGEILKNLTNADRDKITATSNYFKGLNDYRQSLLDYAINDIVIFPYHEASIATYTELGIPKDILEDIYKEASRQDITATYQGKKVNLYSLLDSIKDDYETSKYFLSEKDRHLFEDILLKTIGGKIKEKINNANIWVKNINKIMEDKQKNSNLRFYLSWISKSKESLEEMDTKELVEIFKLDPEALREEDTNRLIKHFRTKISRAEEAMEGSKLQYIDIVSNILDYRNWFEFKIYYQKGDSKKQELSDKIFSVFSGGEKAKTMYIPLFACASAKLSSANSNAPRLIAMDEAFAGVDDDNIEEMFGILKSFNLDYILTSQALWCDYSEVSDIAICELFSDLSSKTLAVKRYRWNGISRITLEE